MPDAVYIIWTILLIVTVLLLPLIVSLLHRTWYAARSIRQYLGEMEEAGGGIAGNTAHIKALDDTQSVAGGILETAGKINKNAETVAKTLSERAKKL